MKQHIKTSLMSFLAFSMLGFSSVASAGSSWGDIAEKLDEAAAAKAASAPVNTPPPGINETIVIAGRVKQVEGYMEDWQQKMLRVLAHYDAYTRPSNATVTDDASFLRDRNRYCKDQLYCNYLQQEVGSDVLASTLLDYRGYTNEQEKAAMQYVKNVTNPIPDEFPPDKDLFNDKGGLTEDGISFFTDLYKRMPILTLAQNSFIAIYTDRTRINDLGQGMSVGKNGKASLLEMMYYEVERRYMNEGWYNQMSATPQDAVLREMANMMAFQNYMAVKRYEQMSRIEALLAAQLGIFGNLDAELGGMVAEADEAEAEAAGEDGGSSGNKAKDKGKAAEGATKGLFGG